MNDRAATRAMLAASLFAAGLVLQVVLMIRRALWLRGIGPICGLHASCLHCPGCYVALSLMLAAIAVAATPAARTERIAASAR